MNKAELIEQVSEQTNVPKLLTEQVINFALDGIAEKLVDGEKVYLVGFGTFEIHKRAAHDAINPQTGERIKIGAYETPVFKPSEPLKKRVRNRKRSESLRIFLED